MPAFNVTSHHGQHIQYQFTALGRQPANFAEAKQMADEERAKCVAATQLDRHFHVIQQDTVYVTSTLEDVLDGNASPAPKVTEGEKARRMRLALATAADQYRSEKNHDLANILSETADLPALSLATLFDAFSNANKEI